MWSERRFFSICCVYRFINLCLVQTAFVPDEYWQSLEPAHKLVFGYGDLPWEWNEGIRNYLYPLIFAFLYKALALIHLDTRFLIVYGPRFLQGMLAAVADLYLFKLAKILYGEKPAFWTLICYWLSWFAFFCSTRTLANTVEAHLTIIALYYYPWPANYYFGQSKMSVASPSVYMAIVAFATVVRPTSAVFWLPLCLWHLIRSRRPIEFLLTALRATLPVVLLSIAADVMCYGRIIFSLWRFLEFNVLQGGSAHFGVHPWHWYLTNCLPTICLTHLILIFYGIRETKDWTFLAISSFYVFVHSFLAHKELRFLLPLLGPLFTYAGRYIDIVFRRSSPIRHDDADSSRKDHPLSPVECYVKLAPKRVNALIAFLFVTNLPVIIYTSLLHQRGVLDVVKFLHDESVVSVSSRTANQSVTVWFLTPCYTCPGYSHLHEPVRLRTLDCTPNLANSPDYVEEADEFHADPNGWIKREVAESSSSLPTHVVVYDWLWTKIVRQQLQSHGYKLCGRFYNTEFPQSERQSKYLIVACLR